MLFLNFSSFALKFYFRNIVTSDCAVGGAEMQKTRLLATRNVYNFSGCSFEDKRTKCPINHNSGRADQSQQGYWGGGP